jgi:hypothetical protein
VAVGSSGSVSSDILITNLTSGFGHGISIGSFTSSGVSNMTVINCTFTNTDQGIRIKSDVDRGGVVQNIGYYNITMGNVQYPILIYCSYTTNSGPFSSLNSITPAIAATFPSNAPTTKMPVYRNITISNVVGTAQSGRQAGLIWGRPEMQISNVTMSAVQITGSKTLGVYCVQGLKMIDSTITVPTGVNSVSFYNAGITFSNSVSGSLVTLDGASTNGVGNNIGFYNVQSALKNTNALDVLPVIGLADSSLTVSNHLNVKAGSQLNFNVGSSPASIVVRSNLALAGTVNVGAGPGFAGGTYTLVNYSGTLTWNSPSLGSLPGTLPAGYNLSFDTNTAGQVKVLVTSSSPVTLSAQVLGPQVILSWPADHVGWTLQTQTNTGISGAGSNWVDVAGSSSVNRVTNIIDTARPSTFYRLRQ